MPRNEGDLARVLKRIFDLNVRPDWWKLPFPGKDAWQEINDLITHRSPHCRGVILLGLDAPMEQLEQSFIDSSQYDICKGFAIGRSIFSAPSKAWLANEIDDKTLIKQVSDNYLRLVKVWQNRKVLGQQGHE
jgi:5-dehydro-2-deoxygluconokinase